MFKEQAEGIEARPVMAGRVHSPPNGWTRARHRTRAKLPCDNSRGSQADGQKLISRTACSSTESGLAAWPLGPVGCGYRSDVSFGRRVSFN